MSVYGENESQGKYWNENPGQSWVAHDASMNERLSSISDILFAGLKEDGCHAGLDIGCGAGSTTRRLHETIGVNSKVTGLDISEKLLNLARAQSKSEQLRYLQADAQSFEFKPNTFDIAVSNCLEQLENCGWIRGVKSNSKTKKTVIYQINPRLFNDADLSVSSGVEQVV